MKVIFINKLSFPFKKAIQHFHFMKDYAEKADMSF